MYFFRYLGCNWNDLTVKQKQKYLEVNQGPRQRFSKSQAIPITIYYGALLAIGVPGNLLTCLIIITNSYMRTPPNFFLLNLAATDLLTLTCKYCRYIHTSLLHVMNPNKTHKSHIQLCRLAMAPLLNKYY